MPTTIFTADVDAETLEQATAVLAKDGDTLPDLLREMMHYIVFEGQAPPLQCYKPNAETLAAIAEADSGELIACNSIADLLAKLNEDD